MKCATSKVSLTNVSIAEDCSFQKPVESDVNFGSCIPEKNLFKRKNIHTIDDSLPVGIKNVIIINKLYDECSDNLKPSKQLFTQHCDNACKSYVDIIEDEGRVSVKDCDCRNNQKNKILSYLENHCNSIVENPGYDMQSKLNKSTNNNSDRILMKKDLLSFALQVSDRRYLDDLVVVVITLVVVICFVDCDRNGKFECCQFVSVGEITVP